MNKMIYYFSGTGNSHRIAENIAAQLTDTALISMAQQQQTKANPGAAVIGLVFPLYYFGLPIIVAEFVKNLEIPDHCYVFVIVTRGELFAGGAKKQLDQLFRNKGRQYDLFRYITMGNNYPFHFFNCSTDRIRHIRNQKSKRKADRLINAIHTRQKSRIFSILDFLPFSWITQKMPTFGYLHFEQIYQNDTCFTVCSSKCVKCKKCENICPTGNISVAQGVVWKQKNCQLCLACYNCCPTNAIQYIDKTNHVNTTGKRQYWNYGIDSYQEYKKL